MPTVLAGGQHTTYCQGNSHAIVVETCKDTQREREREGERERGRKLERERD